MRSGKRRIGVAEFDREFNRKWQERQECIARGETPEPDPFFDPEPVGEAWGWFDPLAFPDSTKLGLDATRNALSDEPDDNDTSDLN